MLSEMKVVAQEVLDELFTDKVLTYQLVAREISSSGERYIVRFHDSRLPSVNVICKERQDFKSNFRTAVLEGVKGQSGALRTGIAKLYKQ